jgi:hypothetical protein
LIRHAIKPLRHPKKGKSGAIFEDSLLNSLLAQLPRVSRELRAAEAREMSRPC